MRAPLIALLLLGGARASAQTICGITPMPDDSASGDSFYSSSAWCPSQYYFEAFDTFGMANGGNSNGWTGMWDRGASCTVDKPFGRIVNTFWLVKTRTPQLYGFVANKMNEVDAYCVLDGDPRKFAHTDNCAGTNYTQFAMAFFYGVVPNNDGSPSGDATYPIWGRAATIVHEARHWDDDCYTAGGYHNHVVCTDMTSDFYGKTDASGNPVKGCDPSYARPRVSTDNETTFARPYSFSVEFLTRYAFLGSREPRAFRANALQRAQYILDNRFNNTIPPELKNLPALGMDPTNAPNPCPNPQVLQPALNLGGAWDFRQQCALCADTTGPDSEFGTCQPCPIGTFSSAGTGSCVRCLGGTYQDAAGQMSCKPCPAGTWSSTVGATAMSMCTGCPAGTYSTTSGAFSPSACQSCPTGTYSGATGAATAMTCMDCPLGRSGSNPGSTQLSDCQPCPPGEYSALTAGGTYTCGLCAGGYYSRAGDPTCSLCGAGTYSGPISGSCTACPERTVSAAGTSAQIMCTPCLGGQVLNPAASSCVGCPLLQISGGFAGRECQSCPAGHAPIANFTGCAPCTSGCETLVCGPNQIANGARTQCVLNCTGGKIPDFSNTICITPPPI